MNKSLVFEFFIGAILLSGLIFIESEIQIGIAHAESIGPTEWSEQVHIQYMMCITQARKN